MASIYAVKGFAEGSTAQSIPSAVSSVDKSKEWQMELLMEKLRSKAGQFKSFVDSAKALRMSLMEKRFPVDSVERNQIQKCLDVLQQSIKVTSLQGMVERLESVSRQLGLKFMVAGPTGLDLFISSDMFYLEVVLDQSGCVLDVKIHHEGKVEQQSCEELVACLSRGDFADFAAQLEGLASIYQLNAEKKVKCKAFSALQSLEADLGTLAQLQSFIKEPFNIVHKSPVGVLEKRKGGHAMKLTYLVPPYDLLDVEKKTLMPLSVEEIATRNLGYSVMVCMEGSTAHKLQTLPLISVNRSPNGKSVSSSPAYAPLSSNNSASLPACFVLRLNKPMPMCLALVKKIQQVTEMECGDVTTPHPMLSLITQHASAGHLDCANNRGLFVSLPDQLHCYFMTENRSQDGILVSNIPFSHPAHVPQILMYLRQQAVFNVLVSSCIRPASKQDLESMIMFEVTALSWQHLSIAFEHPIEETMATAEIDLSDISGLKCKVYGSGCEPGSIPDNASKILQRCWSIPVTMRSLIRSYQRHNFNSNGMTNGGNMGMPPGSDPGRHGGSNGHSVPDFDLSRVKSEPDNGNLPHGQNLGSGRQGFGSDLVDSNLNFQNTIQSDVAFGLTNPFQFSPVLPTSTTVKVPTTTSVINEHNITPTKKHRKRKGPDGVWRSPKRKSDECEIILESSSNDSTPLGTPTSKDTALEVGVESELDKTESEIGEEDMEIEEVDDILKESNRKTKKDKKGSPTIMLDLPSESKSMVAPSVSITPITTASNLNSVLSGIGLERRPGIEIIPIVPAPPTSLPSSITITPISSKTDDRSKDRKSSKNRNEEKSRIEKKRKRKREDSPGGMGPPEKLPPKQDPLSKPVSVSIKPTESPPLSSRPSSPSTSLRKVTSSPTQNLSVSKSSSSKQSSHQSPKHSPGYTTSSPKYHGTSSPKHQSSGSSGKPSMSALKSAASSPSSSAKSGSNESTKSKSSSSNKDKDRKVSSGTFGNSSSNSSSSPKLKSSSVKLKQLDLSGNSTDIVSNIQGGGTSSPGSSVGGKTSSASQVRNRKGSLSAVIDKLTAQHCGPEQGDNVKEGRVGSGNQSGKSPGDTSKNPGEYMVKPSSEGIKLTINKTRTKESKSGTVKSSGTGSPKTHTGLKPGVNSGPASKKPHQIQQKTSSNSASSSSSGKTSNTNNSSKVSGTKSSSSPGGSVLSKSVSKSTGSPKMSSSSDASRRENKLRPAKGSSERDKSVFSSKNQDVRKSSPVALRDENDSYKVSSSHTKLDQGLPPQLMKSLDTKFQIPKLSARNNPVDSDKKQNTDKTVSSETSRNDNSKPLDLVGKGDTTIASTKFPNIKAADDSKKTSVGSSQSSLTLTPNSLCNITGNLKSSTTSLSSAANKSLDVGNLDSNPLRSVGSATTAALIESNNDTGDLPTNNLRNKSLQQGSAGKDDVTGSSKTEPSKCFPSSEQSPLSINLSTTKITEGSQSKYPASSQKHSEETKKLPNMMTEISNKLIPNKLNPPSSSQEAAEMLLDFSSNSSHPAKSLTTDISVNKLSTVPDRVLSSGRRNTPPPMSLSHPPFPNSPSVSVHIVKSPAPSPLINPSPHSVSPCITDDELMDEAVVGIRK